MILGSFGAKITVLETNPNTADDDGLSDGGHP